LLVVVVMAALGQMVVEVLEDIELEHYQAQHKHIL
jgi:hypothetical protein